MRFAFERIVFFNFNNSNISVIFEHHQSIHVNVLCMHCTYWRSRHAHTYTIQIHTQRVVCIHSHMQRANVSTHIHACTRMYANSWLLQTLNRIHKTVDKRNRGTFTAKQNTTKMNYFHLVIGIILLAFCVEKGKFLCVVHRNKCEFIQIGFHLMHGGDCVYIIYIVWVV